MTPNFLVFTLLVCFLSCGNTAERTTPPSSASLQPYGAVPAGPVYLVTLERGTLRVQITNWGARITTLYLPDITGKRADVVLGFDTLTEYQNASADPYFGATVGRVANRIANGTFVLDHVRYNLSKNEGNNTLHGGKIGYDKVLWTVKELSNSSDGPSVTLKYHSFAGEMGFPGSLSVSVTYKLTQDMELAVDMRARPGNQTTPVNLAQHTYWNLGGHNSGTILNNTLRIAGDRVTVVDSELIPTGEMMEVGGTAYDFRREEVIGRRIGELQGGYDINYELMRGGKEMRMAAARVRDPRSGRAMEVYTNKPGMQFYSANVLPDVRGKDGAQYRAHDALCLETQGFPNAVNEPTFPSVLVHPGQLYHHSMLYRFFATRPS